MKVPDAQAMLDFDAALAYASSLGGDAARAAITGFCWGGRMAWLYAAHNPKLRAVVPWYGRLDGDRTQNQPQWPIDVAERLAVPSLGLYGGADPSIPLELVEKNARTSCRRARPRRDRRLPECAGVGDPSKEYDIAAIRAIVMKVSDAQAMLDFDAALAYASSLGGDATRAAITGFCWGGRMAWLYAAHNPKLRAVVPWYGRLDGDRTQNQPQWPIDMAERLAVPSLGLYGGADPSIPLELVERMRARLAVAPAPGEIVVYPNAPHAFFADYRESYRKEAAQDAFARMLAFLRAQGAA